MVNKRAKKRKQMCRWQMRRAILKVLSMCAIIVLVGCVAYLVKDISAHVRSEQIAADLRELYRNSVSAEAFETMELPTEKPLIPVEPDESAVTVEPTSFLEGIIAPESTYESVHNEQDPFIIL